MIRRWKGRFSGEARISNPYYKRFKIFNKSLVGIELKKKITVLDRPMYVGMCVLDISKISLYDFHYNFMLKEYDINNCKILYTDTDSLIYELKNKDIYEVVKKDVIEKKLQSEFDTSNFPQPNDFGIPIENKKVLGKMKHETAEKIILNFRGLRAKVYSLVIEKNNEKNDVVKKVKGILQSTVANEINFQDFNDCLNNLRKQKIISQALITSNCHRVFSIEQKKIALNGFDTKRCILKNSYDTLPYGYKGKNIVDK